MNGIKANEQIRLEHDADVVLMNPKLNIKGQVFDEVVFKTNRRYEHCKGNADGIILKDGLMFQKNYGEADKVHYKQLFIRKYFFDEVLRNLQGENGRHHGITKTKMAYRQKCYYTNMAKLITKWLQLWEQCIKESRIDNKLHHPPLRNPREHIIGPKNAMQFDLIPELPPSGGYQNIVTAMDVTLTYFFVHPTSNEDAKLVSRIIINIMIKHAYLPTTIISDE